MVKSFTTAELLKRKPESFTTGELMGRPVPSFTTEELLQKPPPIEPIPPIEEPTRPSPFARAREAVTGLGRRGLQDVKRGYMPLFPSTIAMEGMHRLHMATLAGVEKAQVDFTKVPKALQRGFMLDIDPEELSEKIVTRMGMKPTEKVGVLPTAQRLGREITKAWYETFGTDPVLFAYNLKVLPQARKVALFNKAINVASKKGAEIFKVTGLSSKMAEKVARIAARDIMGRQMEIAKVTLKGVSRGELKRLIRTLKSIKVYPPKAKLALPPPSKAIVPLEVPLKVTQPLAVPQVKAIIEKAGVIYKGIQPIPGAESRVVIVDPITKSSGMIPISQVTPEKVKSVLAEIRKGFKPVPEVAIPKELEPLVDLGKNKVFIERAKKLSSEELTIIDRRLREVGIDVDRVKLYSPPQMLDAFGRYVEKGIPLPDTLKVPSAIKPTITPPEPIKPTVPEPRKVVGVFEAKPPEARITIPPEKPPKITPIEMRQLRQKIHAWRNVKGMPQTQLRDIVKDKTGFRSLSHRQITPPQLEQILESVKRSRPRRVGYKKVITKQTEDRIQTLKQNLIGRGEMTENVYGDVLKTMRIKEPRFIGKMQFITETQGKQVIKSMLNSVPVVKTQVRVEKSFEKAPAIGKEVTRINTGLAKKFQGPPAKVNPLLDMHHYADSMEKRTGVTFGRMQEQLNYKRLDLNKSIADKQQEIRDVEGYKDIIQDEASLKRINDYVASKLPDYVKGKPKEPAFMTASERKIGEIIQKGLKLFEADVRYNRFHEWYDHNEPIPNAPPQELTRATKILETQGDEALRKWVAGRSWGVIRSGYDIGEVIKPSLMTFRPAPGVPKGHLKIRENLEFQRYERDIIKRYFSYIGQMTYKTELAPDIRAFQQMWNNNRDMFAEPGKVANLLSNYLGEVLGQRMPGGPLSNYLFNVYSQGARAIFLDPRKGVRNLFQNAAFYSSPEDLLKVKKLSPEDWEYFRTQVSQNKGIRRDLMMLDYKGVVGFRKLNELADAVNVMGRTDDVNRIISFAMGLGRTRDALKLHPNYADNPEALRKLMIKSGLADLEIMERRHAIEILATEGEDAYARYVADAVTRKVHFLYERVQRSPAEMGNELNRILSNLLTFRKGYAQRLILDVGKLKPSERAISGDIATGRRSLRSLIGATVLAAFVGYLYQKLTGDRRNPYRVDQILGDLSLGGLATGTQEQIGDFTRDAINATLGDKDALSRTITNITRASDTFLPFYDEAINSLEAITDTYNLDKAILRQIRGHFDDRYTPKPLSEYKKDRKLSEKIQKGFFGREREKIKVPFSGLYRRLTGEEETKKVPF